MAFVKFFIILIINFSRFVQFLGLFLLLLIIINIVTTFLLSALTSPLINSSLLSIWSNTEFSVCMCDLLIQQFFDYQKFIALQQNGHN